jgi:hypothetical protein
LGEDDAVDLVADGVKTVAEAQIKSRQMRMDERKVRPGKRG